MARVIVRIQEVASGTERDYVYPYEWEDSLEYLWSEGNYGCDCNRALFFARAVGEEDPEDRECGETAFRIVSITDDDGKIVYAEEEGAER